jgi:hypothetical protein
MVTAAMPTMAAAVMVLVVIVAAGLGTAGDCNQHKQCT